MATKNKKDTVADLLANIYTNNVKGITPTKAKIPFSDIINSVAFNITITQLKAEDDSSEHSIAHIIDAGKQGLFYYDSNDTTTANDDVCCLVTTTGKRFKRAIGRKFDARWTGALTPYFTTVAAANTAIPATFRFMGLEVDVLLSGGTLTTYWYRDGTGDANLVVKTSDVAILDFIVGDGGTYTPLDNTDTMTNPGLISRSIILFVYGSSVLKVVAYPATLAITDLYVQYNSASGAFKLYNGVYSDTTHGLVIYK